MIKDSSDLLPSTQWSETIWSTYREEDLVDSRSCPRLCVAALLPLGMVKLDWRRVLNACLCGCMNAKPIWDQITLRS